MENDSVPPLIDVVAVEPLPGFNLRITFETGEVRRFNMASLLSKHSGVFVPLVVLEKPFNITVQPFQTIVDLQMGILPQHR